MTHRHAPMVSVIGAAACTQEQADMAEEVGRLLAERGVILVCGGRGGVMESACRGAREAGGLTVGLLPGASHEGGNPYLDVVIPTGLGHARNALVVQAGQVVIAVGGGYGTLSEIGLALKSGKKVVGLHTWQAQQPDGQHTEILEAKSPSDAVLLALSFLQLGGEVFSE